MAYYQCLTILILSNLAIINCQNFTENEKFLSSSIILDNKPNLKLNPCYRTTILKNNTVEFKTREDSKCILNFENQPDRINVSTFQTNQTDLIKSIIFTS